MCREGRELPAPSRSCRTAGLEGGEPCALSPSTERQEGATPECLATCTIPTAFPVTLPGALCLQTKGAIRNNRASLHKPGLPAPGQQAKVPALLQPAFRAISTGSQHRVTYSQDHFLCNEHDRDCREKAGELWEGLVSDLIYVPSTSTT